MHYYKSNNEIMQYCSFSNDIALIMHYRALLKRSDHNHKKIDTFKDVPCLIFSQKTLGLRHSYIFLKSFKNS